MNACFINSLACHFKYYLILVAIISSEIVYAQFVITKFTDSGAIKIDPVSTAQEACTYAKGNEVQINDFLNDDWFHVTTKKCHGYAVSGHIQVTDEVRKSLSNLELKKKRKDSIKEADIAFYGFDIYDPEEIRKNIMRYAADSLLIIWQDLQTKFKKKPRIGAKSKMLLLRNVDIAVLDFVDGYYKLAANDDVFYIKPKGLKEPNFDFSDKRDYVLKLRTVKDSITKEAENKRYLDEQLKKETFYISKWGRSIYDRVKKGDYWVGMTEEMAKVGGLYPGSQNVNKMVTVYGTTERWECLNGVYLYFETGVLKSFQD